MLLVYSRINLYNNATLQENPWKKYTRLSLFEIEIVFLQYNLESNILQWYLEKIDILLDSDDQSSFEWKVVTAWYHMYFISKLIIDKRIIRK